MDSHPPYRRLAQAAEWSLLAVVVLLHIAGWVWNKQLADAGPLAAILADSLPLASLLLLSLWLALGPGSPWLRGGAAALVIATAAAFFEWDYMHRWTPVNSLMGVAPLAAFAGAVLVRLCGLKVHNLRPDREPSAGATFTVRSLLAITTAIALVVGGLEAVRPWLNVGYGSFTSEEELEALLASSQRNGQIRMALACALCVAMSMMACAAILRPAAIWLRLAGLALLIPAAGWYVGHLTDVDSESTVTLTLWAGTTAALLAGSLMPLRLMGYRLARVRAPLPPPQTKVVPHAVWNMRCVRAVTIPSKVLPSERRTIL